jgi:hypothetical protein
MQEILAALRTGVEFSRITGKLGVVAASLDASNQAALFRNPLTAERNVSFDPFESSLLRKTLK